MNNPVVDLAKEKTVTANMDEAGTLTMKVLASVNDFCDDNAGHVAYTSLTFSTEADNGKRICYKAADFAGNTSYALSDSVQGIVNCTTDQIFENGQCVNPVQSNTLGGYLEGGVIFQCNDTDCTSGLIVQQSDAGTFNWNTASNTCNATGWRLPNTNELTTLYNQRNTIGNFVTNGKYWASEFNSASNLAAFIKFATSPINGELSADWSFNARCIKSF